ncbi:MAG: hypothetical protein ACD_77C00349G0013 [uncultured bacterium]|nr:MAG: hypothetical protein ACD_77C00349G0013 [uncultured bacterium]
MRIKFNIPFQTKYGQTILISGSLPELGNLDITKAIPLNYYDGNWSISLNFKKKIDFKYAYILRDNIYGINCESGPSRIFSFGDSNDYYVYDEWRPFTEESPFFSDAFRKVFFKRERIESRGDDNLSITCFANNLLPSEFLYISGNLNILGNWDTTKAVPMVYNKDDIWEINLDNSSFPEIFEYKFLVKNNLSQERMFIWEEGENRTFHNLLVEKDVKIIKNHFSVNLKSSRPKFAGTSIPVFSLRSDESCGIGEFLDLKEMVDLMYVTGQKVLQILPVNDTTMSHTWNDSYPYGAISIYALHPLYINLNSVGIPNDTKFLETHTKLAKKLNELESVDYDAVARLKWDYIKTIFVETWDKTSKSKDYKLYFSKNSEWLIPYAAFCFLRDKYKTAGFSTWPKYSKYDQSEISELTSPQSKFYKEISIHYFVQYHLHIQLSDVHSYANSKGVILKGDIPIGINKNSVDAWFEPQYFNFNGQAGAPPDDFSIKGQNWGFPTYHWDEMEKDGFIWWRKRFIKMGEYFDAYRIDHILGFFRIWEIPSHSTEGLMGHFNPSLPFSEGEIRSFGFNFSYERDCIPFIREFMLDDYFGSAKMEVINLFLDNNGWESYRLKERFSTQDAIVMYFKDHPDSSFLKHEDSLLSLCAEILFIPDSIDHSKFHPRITAQFTKSYQSLSQSQKESYNRVYNNFYYSRNNDFWYQTAMKKLPSLISATGMLVCGEDLGMIPACVPSAMKSLSILTLEIQRMPKDPKAKFGNPAEYPYLSVCTTGTHDTSTLRGWWEENHELSKTYYNQIIREYGDAPLFCEPWLCSKIIDAHLNSPSMLVVLPLQDWLSMFGSLRRENPADERINIPSNPNHYWRYRMHLKTTELIDNMDFRDSIRQHIEVSGRL